MDITLILFVAAVGAAVLLFEMSALRSMYGGEAVRERRLKHRLERIKDGVRSAGAESVLRSEGYLEPSAWSIIPGMHALQRLIMHSGSKATLNQVLIWTGLVAAMTAGLAWMITRQPTIAAVVGLGCSLGPVLVLMMKKARRMHAFNQQLSEALDIVIRALRAGHPFDASLKVVADELPDPIAEEFSITHGELSYGVPIKVAMVNLLYRVPSPPLKAFATAVIIQRETGGNLAEILTNISSVIRGSYRFARKLATLTAEGRMSGIVLAVVPVVLGVLLAIIQPETMLEFVRSARGQELLQIAAGSYVSGFIWLKRLTKIEV